MQNILKIIGRTKPLFTDDIHANELKLNELVSSSKFLVIGAAGSIGQAVTKEIFKRSPKKLHCIDLSENNLTELVRDIRSSVGYIKGEFKTFALDVGSEEFDAMIHDIGPYDYILNLSALKHVRSEEDPYTLMRMINVNILNTVKTIEMAIEMGCKKYFCVSTDKAANPVNMMGASKRIMEQFLSSYSSEIVISTARFANVAFSDGSLLAGFDNRIKKSQPIAAPNDVKRYFLTSQESGELCLLSCLLGKSNEIFFPKLNEELNLITFSEIALRYLTSLGYQPLICSSEKEARSNISKNISIKQWPCYFSESNTTGEKSYEEFYEENDEIDIDSFKGVGIVKNINIVKPSMLSDFKNKIDLLRSNNKYDKIELVKIFNEMLPDFEHEEKGFYLDGKM